MSSTPTGLRGIHLMAVLVVVAICITAIALMAMYKDVDGTVMSLCIGGLAGIAGLAGGVLLKPFG